MRSRFVNERGRSIPSFSRSVTQLVTVRGVFVKIVSRPDYRCVGATTMVIQGLVAPQIMAQKLYEQAKY